MARHLTFVRKPRKLPAVLSLEEVARLLEAAPGSKYKTALSAAYAFATTPKLLRPLKKDDVPPPRARHKIEHAAEVQ